MMTQQFRRHARVGNIVHYRSRAGNKWTVGMTFFPAAAQSKGQDTLTACGRGLARSIGRSIDPRDEPDRWSGAISRRPPRSSP